MQLKTLERKARACRLCESALPLGPRPVFQVGSTATLLIIGQAPGLKVHESGVPWEDASGTRLLSWLGIDSAVFYDHRRVALLPMGFCYPGQAKTGDAPPTPQCAPEWHGPMLDAMPDVKLRLILGKYALARYLGEYDSLTDAVRDYRSLLPTRIALPHPSPRNNRWLKKHPWFERDVVPALKKRVKTIMQP